MRLFPPGVAVAGHDADGLERPMEGRLRIGHWRFEGYLCGMPEAAGHVRADRIAVPDKVLSARRLTAACGPGHLLAAHNVVQLLLTDIGRPTPAKQRSEYSHWLRWLLRLSRRCGCLVLSRIRQFILWVDALLLTTNRWRSRAPSWRRVDSLLCCPEGVLQSWRLRGCWTRL